VSSSDSAAVAAHLSQEEIRDNLKILEDHSSPGTYERICSALADPSPVQFTIDGVIYAGSFPSPILLHSRRDPFGEAARQADSLLPGRRTATGLLVVFGMAGGYHLRELIRRTAPGGHLFVVDSSPAAVAEAVRHLRFQDFLRPEIRFRIASSENPNDIVEEFLEALSGQSFFNLDFFSHPGLRRIRDSGIAEMEGRLRREARRDFMNRSTVARFGAEWHRNTLLNLPYLQNAALINRIKDAFPGFSAAIVAAGPSLDRSLPILRTCADRIVVFAVAHAVKPLFKAGIFPDFVIAVDCADNTLPQFQGVEPDQIRLITTNMIHPELACRYRDRILLFSSPAVAGFNRWMSGIRSLPDSLATGGTVAVTAIDAALYAGCNEIFLFGLDLSFPNDGTTHAKDSACGKTVHSENHVRVPGNYAETVATTRQFAVYLDMVNAYLTKKRGERDVRFLNVTDTGARIEAETVPPSAFMSQFCPKPFDKRNFVATIEKCVRCRPDADSESMLDLIVESATEIRSLEEFAIRAEHLCNAPAPVSRTTNDESDFLAVFAAIKKLRRAKELVAVAIEADLMEFSRRTSDHGPPDGTPQNAADAAFFCRRLAKAAQDTRRLLEEAGGTLKRQP
jgi:hypothetical protein